MHEVQSLLCEGNFEYWTGNETVMIFRYCHSTYIEILRKTMEDLTIASLRDKKLICVLLKQEFW